MKTKRAILNFIANILSKAFSIVLGIIIPKLYIDYFGSEMNGLLSSITGIFVYINLLEAGVGGASIQALYKPISDNNYNEVNGILSATNRYYKRTGVYFLACISVLAFLYPYAIRSDIPYITVVVVILLSSVSSAITYFFQGKYTVLLTADNRGYILTLSNSIFSTCASLMKIVLILHCFNIVVVQFIFSIISILQVVIISIYVKKKFPELNLAVKPNNEAIAQKSSVLIHQIASTIFNNSDVLILSFFLGLKVVSVYSIYNLVFSQAKYFLSMISESLVAGFGQLYIQDNKKFKRLFNFFEVYYMAIVYIVFIAIFALIIPFLKLYTKDVVDINYIDNLLPILFLVVNLLSTARWPAVIAINIAGHFKQTKWRALLEMVINIVVSVSLVNVVGLYGVLIGTIAALIYRTFDMIIYSSKYLLNRSSFIPIKKLVFNIIIAILIILLYQSLNIVINSYTQIVFTGVILVFCVGSVYICTTTLIEKEAREVLLGYCRNLIRKLNR